MKRIVPPRLYGDYPAQLALLTDERGPDECWPFTGYVLPSGYGQMGRNVLAHRAAWEVAHGIPVPAGLVVDHECHNRDLDCRADGDCPHRRCVNPAHLEAVTQGVNTLRGHGLIASYAVAERCIHGHAFSPANTYYRPDRFGRNCRTCRSAADARRVR